MMGGRGVRYAGLARHCPQRQAREPVALQHPFSRFQECIAQRAVMIARTGRLLCAPAVGRTRRRRAGGGAADTGLGLPGFFCHARFIWPDFDTVKILLD